jgi:DNA-binding transcriptional ArsR family regulator
VNYSRVSLLKELADPLRLRVIELLARGPAPVSELASALDVPLPQLSNHLRRLRDAGLVTVRREGRHAIYELADPGLRSLLAALDEATGRSATPALPPETGFARARTCYDHLAGRLGVRIYEALVDRGALAPRADGDVELGPAAQPTFAEIGLEPSAITHGRRRFAYECLDGTENAPHLAGALGAALADALERMDWVDRSHLDRIVTVTPGGVGGLRRWMS